MFETITSTVGTEIEVETADDLAMVCVRRKSKQVTISLEAFELEKVIEALQKALKEVKGA